ncbi:MAG: hypothetical protein LBD94_02240 [Rickettsiales bacterium]|jgi:hypothetical protein|nr:hypothetical protein [Rickettsiales bacterium]
MKKKIIVFFLILSISVLVGYRIQKIRSEGIRAVHNVVRIHAEHGTPKEYVIAKKTTDFLEEPLFVKNGRALVSSGRIKKFAVGQKIKGADARITYVSKDIDLDTGMFVVKVSGNVVGTMRILSEYTGFFLPIDAELPDGAKVIAKDADRVVVLGLKDGDKIVVR